MESKTGKPVRFEITETTRLSLERWICDPEMRGLEFMWPSRLHGARSCLPGSMHASFVAGHVDRSRAERVWHPFHSQDQGGADLQEYWDLRAVQLLLGIRRWTVLCATLALIFRTP